MTDRGALPIFFVFDKVSRRRRFVLESLVCCTVRTPVGHNRTPVCHSLPLISWTSCPRAVATVSTTRFYSTYVRMCTYARACEYNPCVVYSYNARPPRSIRRSFQGLMIGLDCSANIGEPQDHLLPCSPPLPPPPRHPFNVVYDFARLFYSAYHLGGKERLSIADELIKTSCLSSIVLSLLCLYRCQLQSYHRGKAG